MQHGADFDPLGRRKFLKAALAAGGAIILVSSVPTASADEGSSTVVLPTVFNQYGTRGTSAVRVTNLGLAPDTLTVTFTPTNSVRGSTGVYIKKLVIDANSSISLSLRNFLDIAEGLYGSLQITSATQKLTAVVAGSG